jgi:hypothetical protein
MNKSLCLLLLISIRFASAQMPHDAIYMPKNTTCFALIGSKSTWKNYWEGSLKRDNPNLGTFNSNAVMAMAAVGLSSKLNVMVSAPYISNYTSDGNLKGQKGIQDLSLWAKYKVFEHSKGLSVHGVLGASTPLTNYVPDFLPLSIGLKSKSLTGRVILNYKTKAGIYVNLHGGYIARDKVKLDRDSYQVNGTVVYSNLMAVPNATEAGFRVGYLKSHLQVESFVEQFSCLSGDNIRRNDMPAVSNKMAFRNVGLFFKYQPKNLGFNLRVSQTISGQNIGQTKSLSAGVLYQLNY